VIGSEINQLAQAESVFFQDERTLYVSNNSILMFIQIRSFAEK
jgi:hypothetical protein